MKLVSLLTLPVVFCLCNCSSIVSKSDYPVTFTSEKATQVKIKDQKSGSIVHQGTTPTTATLPASAGFFQPAKYSVMTAKTDRELHAELDPWYFGNLGFGGILGFLIVDPATGNMWKLPQTKDVN